MLVAFEKVIRLPFSGIGGYPSQQTRVVAFFRREPHIGNMSYPYLQCDCFRPRREPARAMALRLSLSRPRSDGCAAIVSPVRTPVGAFGGVCGRKATLRVHPQRLSVRGRPHTCSLSNRKPVDATIAADLVGITSHTPSAHHAYGLAAQFRGRGVPVVLGGPHVTLMPDEAQDHADVIFVGEAEILWEQFLKEFANGRARGSRLPLGGLGAIDDHVQDFLAFAIDQPKTDRARRPSKTGGLSDGFGRVGWHST